MSLAPVFAAPPAIQLHIVAALLSVLLGPVVLYRRRRDRAHKILGYVWITAMVSVAVSALFISDFASDRHFGVLHLFVPLTLGTLAYGVTAAIRGDITGHERSLRSLYWNGLLIAGSFNFLPGRLINQTLFGNQPDLGWVVIGCAGSALLINALRPYFLPFLRRIQAGRSASA